MNRITALVVASHRSGANRRIALPADVALGVVVCDRVWELAVIAVGTDNAVGIPVVTAEPLFDDTCSVVAPEEGATAVRVAEGSAVVRAITTL